MNYDNTLRIKRLREYLKLRQDEFAQILDYKQGSISYIEKDDSRITKKFIERIIDKYPKINIEYLETGHGEMFNEQQTMTEPIEKYHINKRQEKSEFSSELLLKEIESLHNENKLLKDRIKSLENHIKLADEFIETLRQTKIIGIENLKKE